MSRLTRVRPGDILEIVIPEGRAYAQYVGEHPSLGGTLFLDPTIHPRPLEDLSTLELDRGFHVFYPVRAAVKAGLVTVRDSAPIRRTVPERLRRAGARAPDGRVLTWVLLDGGTQRIVERLGEADRCLPIGSIWNHEFLMERIAAGWRPELEG